MFTVIFIKICSVLLSTAEGNSSVKCIHILLKIREKDNLEYPGVDGRIFRWILRKWDVGVWTGSSRLRIGTGGGHL